MTSREKAFFHFQNLLGRVLVFITAPLVFLAIKLMGYRVRNMSAVRRTVRSLMHRHAGPWLICANHLTMIDSVILSYAMIPTWRYMFRFRLLPWNIPEKMNFNRNIFVGLLCFLLKCIPVVRGGDRDGVKSAIGKCTYLLGRGENLMIFPEGTRTRSGRVNTDDFPYGTGRLFCSVPGCRVMCFYLRGDGQETYSTFPRHGETFTLAVEECRPETPSRGLRAHRDCSARIIECLARMETNYFESLFN